MFTISLTCFVIFSGSITVTFVIDGNFTDVNATAYSVCESISNSTSYTFNGYTLSLSEYMTINNQTFFGVSCGVTVSSVVYSFHAPTLKSLRGLITFALFSHLSYFTLCTRYLRKYFSYSCDIWLMSRAPG